MGEEARKSDDTVKTNLGERGALGLVLIVIGIAFLFRNIEILELRNWWALFILIPAFGAFGHAWKIYQNNGRQVTRQVRGRIVGGLFPFGVACIFLLELNIGELWPVFIILAGIAVILS